MKQKAIACAAIGAALFAGASSAVSLNPRGLGQVLIYPYYTVNKGQDTLISLVNVGDTGKLVQITFREGYNGREVTSVYAFLSPHDVWTAGVSAAGDGARITTGDRSCTLSRPPALNHGAPFSTSRFVEHFADGGPTGTQRVREGFIEAISWGDIPVGSETEKLIEHVQNGRPGEGTPAGCAAVTYNTDDLVTPTNTLAGSAGIVNATEGIFYSYNADALSDFTAKAIMPAGGSVDLIHANSEPDIDTEAVVLVDGKPLTLWYENSIDAVSAVFTADAIYNEFLADSSMGAATDWIVTLPTKRFYTDPQYSGVEPGGVLLPAIQPFEKPFNEDGDGTSFSATKISQFDREEGVWEDDVGTPPSRPPSGFPYQVNAISFPRTDQVGDPSRAFGSAFWSASDYRFPNEANGWMKIDLSANGTRTLRPDRSGIALKGLPVTGFMAYNIVNEQAQPGKLANYNGVFPHRASAACESSRPPQPGTQDPCS